MSNLLKVFANHLHINNIGVASGGNRDIVVDSMPDAPDNLIAIFEYRGDSSSVANADNRSINVKVRNTSYDDTRSKIWEIYSLYKPENDQKILMLDNTRWCIFKPRGTPFKLETDESDREVFNMNISIITDRD